MDVASPAQVATTPAPPARTRPLLRWSVHAGWVLLLALATELRVGRFGFHPSDQGFILAQAWRVLHGEVPHADIISARPLGSAVLHVADYALPMPLFFGSSFLAMVEIIVATIAFAALVTRRRVLDWGPGMTAIVAAASLINLNAFPLMAWHTIDGIALTACGAWALDAGLGSGRALARRGGLALLGSAVFVKQSFVLAAVIGLVWLLLHPATRAGTRRALRLVLDLLALGAPGLAYVAWVSLGGGFTEMVEQVTGGVPAYGERLLGLWLDDPEALTRAPGRELGFFAAIAVVLLAVRLPGDRLGAAGRVASWVLVLAGAAAVVRTVVDGRFTGATRWADVLWWILAVSVPVNAAVRRKVPWPGLLVLATGFMISLSWGNDTPTLLTGTLALTALLLLGELVPARPRRWVTATAGLTAVAVCGGVVVARHDQAAYLDVGHDRLTEDLGAVTPAMAGIRTNPSTFTFVRQIRDCLDRFPAPRTAILPDSPFAYPAFGLRNPFPLEWPLPLEIVGDAPERMLATADRLNREGGYLVLFQTDSYRMLATGGPVPESIPAGTPVFDYLGLEKAIQARLTGRTVTCGSFVGEYVP
ncbi:hypothetical protein [Amycolatopsis rifamycinica]|uniref:Glycosyltransferase RgtA/B/C/D-like domain-containing protein n=1 Tax=Amycolatopsis rifamycinica TaxID=287986 RepID=A0A066U2G6_9PSEU|nr:hypothetical protein [Amycolatopsis rifamycinica]KDN21270.1 hypothetical protein DV20_15375 [Amycolatopsis rifamycinica]